jgi:cysteine desulfurase/selenocysteine lyase
MTVLSHSSPLEGVGATELVPPPPSGLLDVDRLRLDFPILSRRLDGDLPLVYLDSANTSQKPRHVIDTMAEHYALHNANVARAVHQLGAESTAAFEDARDKVAGFIGAPSRNEVIFTKNSTEALNLVANALAWADGDLEIGPGDEVLITEMEHHSNIVPWQLLTERKGATLRWFGLTDDGRLDLSDIDTLINERTAVVSLAVPQMPVDVATCGADLVAFTGHKMVGPTGIGVLWGRSEVLAALPPFQGGGEMIETVTMAKSTYAEAPHKFEAGTPPIVQAVGLGAAVDYLTAIGMDAVAAYERAITAYALEQLQAVEGLTILGPREAVDRGGAISFEIAGIHPHDVSQLLDSRGVAVRAGHHCAKPAHNRFGVQSSTRASFYLYTRRPRSTRSSRE